MNLGVVQQYGASRSRGHGQSHSLVQRLCFEVVHVDIEGEVGAPGGRGSDMRIGEQQLTDALSAGRRRYGDGLQIPVAGIVPNNPTTWVVSAVTAILAVVVSVEHGLAKDRPCNPRIAKRVKCSWRLRELWSSLDS